MTTATDIEQATQFRAGKSQLQAVIAGMLQIPDRYIYYRSGQHCTRESFREIAYKAHRLAQGLRELGVVAGDRVAIHGETSIEWLLADLACVIAGAVSVAVYPTSTLERARRVVEECRARLVFTDNDQFADLYRGALVTAVLMGRSDTQITLHSLIKTCAVRAPFYDVPTTAEFTVVSTSGTLSDPRLFAVTSSPLLFTMEQFRALHDISTNDRLLLFLPLSHLPQRMIVYGLLSFGVEIILSAPHHFVEDARTQGATITVIVPRVLEYIYEKFCGKRGDSNKVTCANVLGHRMRLIFVGSAPSRPELLARLIDLGFPIYEVYGTTELGIIALSYPNHRRLGYVGPIIPWGKARIAPDGELLVRTSTPFLFRFLDEQDAARFANENSQWLPTGDIARIDDGYIKIVARVRDFVVLQNGEKVFINHLESKLAEALRGVLPVVVGNGKKHVQALLFGEQIERYRDDEIKAAVRDINNKVQRLEKIKQFARINRLPSVAEECMTATMKVRRHVIESTYAQDALWIDVP